MLRLLFSKRLFNLDWITTYGVEISIVVEFLSSVVMSKMLSLFEHSVSL